MKLKPYITACKRCAKKIPPTRRQLLCATCRVELNRIRARAFRLTANGKTYEREASRKRRAKNPERIREIQRKSERKISAERKAGLRPGVNRERLNAQRRQRYKLNLAKLRERARCWAASHRELVNQRACCYRVAHLEIIRAKQRKYRRENREEIRRKRNQWYATHKNGMREQQRLALWKKELKKWHPETRQARLTLGAVNREIQGLNKRKPLSPEAWQSLIEALKQVAILPT